MRHLFRGQELTTMLNRIGHSETYRFALELETAVAKVLQGSSNLLSTHIVVNSAAIATASQESSNLLSTQIVGNPAAIAKLCRDPKAFCPLSCKPCSHCQSFAGISNPCVHSDSCELCGHCQALQGSSNLLSTQIVVTLRPLPQHCRGPQTFCPLR